MPRIFTDSINRVRLALSSVKPIVIIVAVVVSYALLTHVFADTVDCSAYPAHYTGSGTSGSPYHIITLTDLQCVSSSLSSYYILDNDIDASATSSWDGGKGFAPIGPNSGTPFKGGFDGNNHIVSNLHINRPTENYVGLFGYTTWETKYIRNIGLADVTITGGYMTGGLAGLLTVPSNNPVVNSFVTGTVRGGASNSEVGGFTADNHGYIKNCYVHADIIAQNYRAGGFIGENRTGKTVTDSYFAGTVTKTGGATLATFAVHDEGVTGGIVNVFYDSDLSGSSIPACALGCDNDTITGKTSAQMHDIATFTDLDTPGLSSAWDFTGTQNDDSATHDFWAIEENYPTLATFLGLADSDGDGYSMINDCNDADAAIHQLTTYYADADADEYGDSSITTIACGAPSGYVGNADDCDDTTATIHPHIFYLDTDDDGYGDSSMSVSLCGGPETTAPDEYVSNGTDCAPVDPTAFSYTTFYPDTDNDGYGIPGTTTQVCGGTSPAAPSGYAANNIDCDDTDVHLYPGSFDGSGTTSDPYIITTLKELSCINGTSATRAAYYELGNDIDASATSSWNGGLGFEPIGPSRTTPFQGGFDGMGHTVSHLYIHRTGDVGFFGFTDYNTKYIRNIGLTDINITGAYTGGLASTLSANEPVENVYVTGSVTGTRPGGLASINWADITNSFTNVTVTSTGNWMAGGLVMENHRGDISNTYVDGDVLGNTSRIGAFLAYNDGTIANSFYNSDALTNAIGACPSTAESGFGGCTGQGITAKTSTELGLVETFTSILSAGLTSAWDFLNNPFDDTAIHNLWKMVTHPILAVFTGEADRDGDGYDGTHDCDDTDVDFHEITTYYIDADSDGYGTTTTTVDACLIPSGYAPTSDDCDDTTATIHPHIFYLDTDDDGYGDSAHTTAVCGDSTVTAPEGYIANGTDCNPLDGAAHTNTIFYADTDNDGYGIPGTTTQVCGGTSPAAPSGYAANNIDCDDTDVHLYPGSFDGSGTTSDPYIITTLKELSCINGTSATRAAYYELGNDIDASATSSWNGGLGFEPIGPSRTTPFQGGFDGMGHTVSHLYIHRTGDVGFFGFTDYNTKYIRNIGLTDINITGAYTGGLASTLSANEPVENVYVTGSVTGTRPGGLASINWADITNSFTNVTVTSTGNWMAGGLVMENHRGDISNTYVDGDVLGNTSRIGAFLAYNDGTIANSFYNSDALTNAIGACPSTAESGFGGCTGQGITAKTSTELGLVETFTSILSAGLTSAWDFLNNPFDDTAIHNLWKMVTHPILAVFTGEADRDGDGYDGTHDCDDTDVTVHEAMTYYRDIDNDGFGDLSTTTISCGAPTGYVSNAYDCSPSDNSIYTRVFYVDGDDDGYGDTTDTLEICGGVGTTTPDGYTTIGGDCDDTDTNTYPRTYYRDTDGDGYGLTDTHTDTCGSGAPQGYVLLEGDGNDADASISPGIMANITIGTTIVSSGIKPIGADLTSIAGGTNFAVNNLVRGGGFEPASIREIQRIERTGVENGYRWIEWDYNGGMDAWDTRATGFLNGATLHFYRMVNTSGDPVPYTSGLHDPAEGNRVISLGEARIPLPGGFLPQGGFVIDNNPGGKKRIYIDTPLSLAYGDYALLSFTTSYMPAENMSSRLARYRDANHPGLNLFWTNGATARLTSHSGTIPPTFTAEDPGETCLKVNATLPETVTFGQFVYEGSNPADLWYSQLHPGDRYRVEVWMRQDGLGDGGHVFFGFDGASYYDTVDQRTPWTVTGDWRKYTYDFTAPAYPSAPGFIAHTLHFTGPGTLYVDNWNIYKYDATHNYEPFGPHENSLDPILASFPETGEKPTVRFYPVQYDNSTVEAMLGNYPNGSFNSTTGDIGTGTAMTIAQTLRWAYATGNTPEDRIVPWITLPEEYTETDFDAIIEYLGVPYNPEIDTPTSKPYAYKRYMERHNDGTPWTAAFSRILVEYGNETWHQGAGGYGWNGFSEPGYINYGGKEYGLFAQYMLGHHIAESSMWTTYGLDSKIKFVLGANYIASQNGQTSYGEQAMQHNTIASYLGHANYVGPKWETGDTGSKTFNDHGIQETLIGPLVSTTIKQLIATTASIKDTLKQLGTAEYDLAAYEGGPSGYWSGAGTEIDEEYGKSLAMGVAALDTWLYSSLHGYTYQNYHAIQSGNWWTSHTMPEQGGFRPQAGWLALMLRNRYATGTDMVATTVSTTPTYRRAQSLIPLIESYTMRDDEGNYSVFIISRKVDGTHDDTSFGDGYTPVTLHLPFTSTPTNITLHKLARPDGSAADPRENNRTSNNIAIVSEEIPTTAYASDFVINQTTGGEENGMPPGTVYLYTFSFCDGTTTCVDVDNDGYYATNDCNDHDTSVHALTTYYEDADGDGYGLFGSSITACQASAPEGYASLTGDCDSGDGSAHNSDATYYRDTDGDGYGLSTSSVTACHRPEGYVTVGGDCNDSNALVNACVEDDAEDTPPPVQGGFSETIFSPESLLPSTETRTIFSRNQINAITDLLRSFGVDNKIIYGVSNLLFSAQQSTETSTHVSAQTFTKNLKSGITDPEVKTLQTLLNNDIRTRLTDEGPGSPGHETNYFGALTTRAVILFQELHANFILTPENLIKGTGYVGKRTRDVLNSLGL
ncbi:MAG: peptidoglycan-binding protein [Candidatus Yonathbacteria bacterium]|nr:peptidoglycan-binding protein [Candidatus Yonathbacteria bacterium]